MDLITTSELLIIDTYDNDVRTSEWLN